MRPDDAINLLDYANIMTDPNGEPDQLLEKRFLRYPNNE